MAITLNNACEKIVRECTAPAGGVTAFTLKMLDTQDRPVVLPLVTAASGVLFSALMQGGIDGAPIATTVACVHGAPLAWSTANSNFAEVATGSTSNAQAVADAVIVSGSTTASMILRFPSAFVAP